MVYMHFLLKSNKFLVMALEIYLKVFLYTTLDTWVFEYFILADELFAKALQSHEICISINNNSCEKLELPITFDENF